MWLFDLKKKNNTKECVSNATAVQKICRNSRAEAKRILRSAMEKNVNKTVSPKTPFAQTKIRSP